MSEEYYIKNPKKETLTEQQLFGISLGLIIAEQNGAYVDSLDTGKTDYPQKQMMQKNWRISGREDALAFLEARISEGHRKLFNRLLEIYMAQGCPDASQVDFSGTEFEITEQPKNDYSSDDDEQEYQPTWMDVIESLENLDEIYELEEGKAWFGDLEDDFKVGTDAWDFGRIVFASRICYTLGYITENEAWHYIELISKMAKQKFTNWDNYATSYVLGRAMWCGDDGEWETVAGFAADALDAKQSPWPKLKWK